MQVFKIPFKSRKKILSLGAESCGNFSIFKNGEIFFSDFFEDLLEEKNFENFKKEIFSFLKKNNFKPDAIICDLHPLFKTSEWGRELAEKFNAEFLQVQHHYAHIFSVVGEYFYINQNNRNPVSVRGFVSAIACDGTGYGLDGKIWGGEVFKISKIKAGKTPHFEIKRIGHLENQIMAGGDLAVREPARMLLSILQKFLDKDSIYNYVAQYYSKNEFKILYNQIKQNFNCVETSSVGRVLDAVSVLLGFCKNQRAYKHEPIDLLEANSVLPENFLRPKIEKTGNLNILLMNPLFEYLVEGDKAGKNKSKLAGKAQVYVAEGLYNLAVDNFLEKNREEGMVFAGGGLCGNKLISSFFEKHEVVMNKKIPRGDSGISFGQIFYYLLANSRN